MSQCCSLLYALLTPLAGYLPEPLKSQGHVFELAKMLADESLREQLEQSLDVCSSYSEVTAAKVKRVMFIVEI